MQALVGHYAMENFNSTRKDNQVLKINQMKDNVPRFQNYISEIFVNSQFQKLVDHDRD